MGLIYVISLTLTHKDNDYWGAPSVTNIFIGCSERDAVDQLISFARGYRDTVVTGDNDDKHAPEILSGMELSEVVDALNSLPSDDTPWFHAVTEVQEDPRPSLLKRLYVTAYDSAESFEASHVGSDLAYLMGAILRGTKVDYDNSNILVSLLTYSDPALVKELVDGGYMPNVVPPRTTPELEPAFIKAVYNTLATGDGPRTTRFPSPITLEYGGKPTAFAAAWVKELGLDEEMGVYDLYDYVRLALIQLHKEEKILFVARFGYIWVIPAYVKHSPNEVRTIEQVGYDLKIQRLAVKDH